MSGGVNSSNGGIRETLILKPVMFGNFNFAFTRGECVPIARNGDNS